MFGLDDAIIGAVAGGFINNIFAGERQNDAQAFAGQQSGQAQAFNSAEAARQRDWASEQGRITREFNAAEAEKQRFFVGSKSDTAYQRAVADLKAANLNPMLAYMHGSASTPSAAAGSSGAPGGSSASGAPGTAGIASPGHDFSIPAAMQTSSQIRVNDAIEERTRAEASRTRAEEAEIKERTPTHAVNIERTKQEIAESSMRIEKIIQETSTSYHSAQNIQQQTRNLQEAVPQIRANIENLRALAKMHGAMQGKSEAETAEIRQRVAANLPKLEAILKNLEGQQRNLALPSRENQAAAAQSFIGQLGAYLREINPLKNWLP